MLVIYPYVGELQWNCLTLCFLVTLLIIKKLVNALNEMQFALSAWLGSEDRFYLKLKPLLKSCSSIRFSAEIIIIGAYVLVNSH